MLPGLKRARVMFWSWAGSSSGRRLSFLSLKPIGEENLSVKKGGRCAPIFAIYFCVFGRRSVRDPTNQYKAIGIRPPGR
jgi:hypothetical protein